MIYFSIGSFKKLDVFQFDDCEWMNGWLLKKILWIYERHGVFLYMYVFVFICVNRKKLTRAKNKNYTSSVPSSEWTNNIERCRSYRSSLCAKKALLNMISFYGIAPSNDYSNTSNFVSYLIKWIKGIYWLLYEFWVWKIKFV